MELREQWIRWEPIDSLSPIYFVDSITDTLQTFEIILEDADNLNKRLKINFKNGVNAYRRTDDNLQLELIDELNKEEINNYYSEWTFFKVENSRYIQWLTEQSYEVVDPKKLVHYAIFEEDLILDIVATYEPHVTIFSI